jgi:mono/diheme cytochrome c family protein
MKRLICFVSLLAVGLVLIGDGHAQIAGDPQTGLALAQQTCSTCHAIRKGDDLSPNLDAPTFSELANTPGMTNTALLVRL